MSKIIKAVEYIVSPDGMGIVAAVMISIPFIGLGISNNKEINTAYAVITPPTTVEVSTDQITIPVVKNTEQIITLYKCYWGNFEITSQDFELLCKTVYCEAGNQSIDTQIMVALTVLNRVQSDIFPNSIRSVVYQDRQYKVSTWQGFEQTEWTESVEQAVTYALEVNEYPKDMYYFRTDHYHSFGVPYKKADDLYFSTEN